MERVREVVYYQHHFKSFFNSLSERVKIKIDEVLFMVSILDRIPIKFFKKVENVKGLFEIRIEFEGNIYRVFCCLDGNKLVILFNGFQKKSQKTPKDEIDRAISIMNEYLSESKNENKSKR